MTPFVSPSAFLALLDNYNHQVGQAEVDTPQEKTEISAFLDAVLATPTMKEFHKYLVKEKLAKSSVAAFKKQLHDLWFKNYRRGR